MSKIVRKNVDSIIRINVKNKINLLNDHLKKQSKLIAYLSKFKTNQEHAYPLGVVSSSQVVINPPAINSFTVFSQDVKVINDIKRLEEAITILSCDLEKQRNMFMYVSFKKNKNLTALPAHIRNYCEKKYPRLLI